ncbi:Putative UPF0481 protein At3g02645 [Linum perenne]
MASPYSIIINPKFTEKEWIIQMERNLELDLDAVAQTPVSIFHVPESVRIVSRHAYSPQLLALGPYHHWKPDLYHAETFKLAAAKRAHLHFRLSSGFREFVSGISHLVPDVRASYDGHLHMSDKALAWIMSVDGLFLLHLIFSDFNSIDSHCPLFSDPKSLLSDAVMLENQIPMFLLDEILTNFTDSSSIAESLASVSVDFCRKVSPLEFSDPDPMDLKPRHLLDLFYQLILTRDKPNHKEEFEFHQNGNGNGVIMSDTHISPETKTEPGTGTGSGFFQSWLRRISEDETAGIIPTATQLGNAGMKFGIAKQGIRGISFNKDTKTLYLPVFTWNPNCEVVMRNLVAYEAVAKPDHLVLGRYADLMNAICRTPEDAKLLREEGIIIGDGNDVVWEVFGRGMGVGSGRRTVLEGEIEAVNEFHVKNRRVEIWKVGKRYGKRAWEITTFVAALFLLLFFFFHIVVDIFRYPPGSGGGTAVTRSFRVASLLLPPSGSSLTSLIPSGVATIPSSLAASM